MKQAVTAGRAQQSWISPCSPVWGQARNVIKVLSADVVVVCGGGGPGTASEAAHALNDRRPLILLAVPVVGGFVRWL
ncbi:hypothetical protein VB777_02360 [Synechococcus sp. CCY9202]|nr:hypothetical protein [Synechococcus sp. CCY9202]